MNLQRDLPEAYSRDHFPGKLFYPTDLREKFSKQNPFQKIPAHKKCNNQFGKDETYFVRVLTTMVAERSPIGEELFQDFGRHVQSGKNVKVLKDIMGGMSNKWSSGLYMPPGQMTVQLDREKIERIVWKLTRGIHFLNLKKVLPENTPGHITRYDKMPQFPPEFQEGFIKKVEPAGPHPDVLIYKYGYYDEPGNKVHIMLIYLWKVILFFVSFHDLGCGCDECKGKHKGHKDLDA